MGLLAQALSASEQSTEQHVDDDSKRQRGQTEGHRHQPSVSSQERHAESENRSHRRRGGERDEFEGRYGEAERDDHNCGDLGACLADEAMPVLAGMPIDPVRYLAKLGGAAGHPLRLDRTVLNEAGEPKAFSPKRELCGDQPDDQGKKGWDAWNAADRRHLDEGKDDEKWAESALTKNLNDVAYGEAALAGASATTLVMVRDPQHLFENPGCRFVGVTFICGHEPPTEGKPWWFRHAQLLGIGPKYSW